MPKNIIQSQVRSKIRWGVVGILALCLITAIFDAPQWFNQGIDAVNKVTAFGLPNIPEKPFRLGLDLQGGAHLVYQANTKDVPAIDRATAVEGVRDVIERRVNGIGVSEPTVQTTKVSDDYHIIVELPGITDVKAAIAMIGETPILEFKEESNTPARDLTAEEKKQLETFNIDAKKRADDVGKKISTGLDYTEAVKQFSDDPNTKANNGYFDYVSKAAVPAQVFSWAEKAKPGDISTTPIETEFGHFILKRGAERDGEIEVTAKHILICFLGAEKCDNPTYTKQEAEKKAREIFDAANANNFAALAKENSTDIGTKDKGGDLGQVAKSGFVKPFADAVFAAKAGEIIGPVETEFGYHIIYKTGEVTPKEYELWGIFIRNKLPQDILPPTDPYKSTGLSGKQLQRAEVATDQRTGQVQILLKFNDEGKELFRQITERNVGKTIAIYLDGQPITNPPTVQTVIPDGEAVISGSFSLVEARTVVQRLNAGALPVPVELVSQQTVGATLGVEALQKSVKAAIVGFIIVLIFMVLYYRLPGFLAGIALLLYVSLSLAVFKLIGVTLTLSGIAGFILSIGMAVDGNILIFERMREELRNGRGLVAATEEGFVRAWDAIRDGNVANLFTCIVLVWFGSSFVQGFATTLAIGVLISMFSAITVSRVLLRFVTPWFANSKYQAIFFGVKK